MVLSFCIYLVLIQNLIIVRGLRFVGVNLCKLVPLFKKCTEDSISALSMLMLNAVIYVIISDVIPVLWTRIKKSRNFCWQPEKSNVHVDDPHCSCPTTKFDIS